MTDIISPLALQMFPLHFRVVTQVVSADLWQSAMLLLLPHGILVGCAKSEAGAVQPYQAGGWFLNSRNSQIEFGN